MKKTLVNESEIKFQEFKTEHWSTKYNAQKKGFFQTDLDIVSLEMSKIKITGTGKVTIADLTGGEGKQIQEMEKILKDQNLEVYSFYNELETKRYAKYNNDILTNKSAFTLNADLFNLQLGTKKNNCKSGTILITRNNPPYIEVEDNIMDRPQRFEELSIIPNANITMKNGIMIFECPINRLEDMNFRRKLCFRFENINIFKFPETSIDSTRKYTQRQIIIFGTRREYNKRDLETEQLLLDMSIKGIDKLQDISKHEGHLYEIDQNSLNKVIIPDVFKETNQITEADLVEGFNSVVKRLTEPLINSFEKIPIKNTNKPIIEQTAGHIAVKFSAGAYNGISKSKVLIRGLVEKQTSITITGDEDEIQLETDRYIPTIEILSSNGDYFIKTNKKKKQEETENS